MRKTLETKIRLNAILICIIAAIICGGMIFYIYDLNNAIAGQKENIEKSNQILTLTDSLVVSVQQAQLASNTYLFTNNRKYLNQFQQLITLVENQIDSLLILSGEDSQIEKLSEMSALLKQKELVISRLARSFSRSAPFDTIKVQLQEVEPEVMEDTVVVTITRQDTIITITPQNQRRGFWKRLGEAFSPKEEQEDIINISTVTTVDTVINVTEEKQKVISQVIELSEEASQRYARRMERIGRNVSQLIASDQEISMQFLNVLLKLHRETLNSTLREVQKSEQLIRKNYTLSVVVSSISLALILLFIIFIISDVNKGYKARIALAEEKKKTEDLMKSRHELLLSVSHDIKAPLSSILGYLDLFQSEPGLSEKEEKAINSMQNSGVHILSLLTNLLEFSRLEQGKLEVKNNAFDLCELSNETSAMFRPLAIQKKLDFNYQCNVEDLRYIESDNLKIRQILVNILSNAIKYTTEGEIRFQVNEGNNSVIFKISDTGAGIPKEKMETLYQPFTRVEENSSLAEGSGFGLYVVKGLVDLLNGTIDINSKPGTGTHIVITLPVRKISRDRVKTRKDVKQSLSGKKYKILIIDDDPVFLSMMKEKLTRMGHMVSACQTVSDFENLENEMNSYDVVLTDMEMGVATGKEILEKVKKINPFIPVFLMTARTELDALKEEGFDGCLRKPFSVDSLIAMYEKDTAIEYSFTSLKEMFGDDVDAIKNILQAFIDSTNENLKLLQQAVSEDDFYWSQSLSHKMLPMFAQLDLDEQVKTLRKMDDLRGKSPKEFPEWKTEIGQFIEETKIVLKNILRRYFKK